MTQADLQVLLEYHYWARDRLLAGVEPLSPEQYNRDLGSSFKSIRDTLVHIYSAEWAWHSRWHGHSPTALLSPDDFPDLPTLRREWNTLEAGVRAFTSGIDDTGRFFEYRLLSGKEGRSAFWQMLQHIVNHASYHRGQVTTMLRQVGAPPPQSLDLIAFYRERG